MDTSMCQWDKWHTSGCGRRWMPYNKSIDRETPHERHQRFLQG